MKLLAKSARALLSGLRRSGVDTVLRLRVQSRNPTLRCHPTAIWDYGFQDLCAIHLGSDVAVGPFAEILVYRHAQNSGVEGSLSVGDRSVLSSGVNLRAAGGRVCIGIGCGIGQHTVIVAANHSISPGAARLHTPWDETRCGVSVGDNVWVGANCVLLPGSAIGDNAVIAAGSVVTGPVPAGELWGGVPARRIRRIEADA